MAPAAASVDKLDLLMDAMDAIRDGKSARQALEGVRKWTPHNWVCLAACAGVPASEFTTRDKVDVLALLTAEAESEVSGVWRAG